MPQVAAVPHEDAGHSDVERRAVIADWLAAVFLRPLSMEFIGSLDTGADAAMLDLLDGDDAFRPGVASMRAALASGGAHADLERRLATEFTLLFAGAGGPNTVPPYASAYLSERGSLFQEATGEMDALLRRHDLAVGDALREPADHLSIELAMLAHLRRMGPSGEADASRLRVHLLAWTPAFSRRCADLDRTGFYAGAALLLDALLADEPADHAPIRIIDPTLCKT